MIEVKNARIESVSLSTADHGQLSAWLHLSYGGSGQGFGGYSLGSVSMPKNWKTMGNYAGYWIVRTLEVVGVTEWNDLVDKTIRVKCEHSKVHAIGNILEDKWFNPTEEFREDL
jgi:hypothetical protein